MSTWDWIGFVLLIPFIGLVICLVTYLVAGCIGSQKRYRKVQQERQAARLASERAPQAESTISSEAADGT